MSFNAVVPGSLVSFKYLQGSVPGSNRLVRVTKVDPRHIGGDDLQATPGRDGSIHRNFLKTEIDSTSLRVVAAENEDVVPATNFITVAGLENLDANVIPSLIGVMSPTIKPVRYDAATKMVVVKREQFPCVELEFTGNEMVVNFVNQAGASFGLSFNGDFRSGISGGTVRARVEQAELAKFVTLLVTHINQSSTGTVTPPAADSWPAFVAQQKAKGNGIYANVT